MSDKIDRSFRERQACRDKDNGIWTARDALEAALAEIVDDENVDQLMLHYTRLVDGDHQHIHYVVNLTHESHVGLLEFCKAEALDEWRGIIE